MAAGSANEEDKRAYSPFSCCRLDSLKYTRSLLLIDVRAIILKSYINWGKAVLFDREWLRNHHIYGFC